MWCCGWSLNQSLWAPSSAFSPPSCHSHFPGSLSTEPLPSGRTVRAQPLSSVVMLQKKRLRFREAQHPVPPPPHKTADARERQWGLDLVLQTPEPELFLPTQGPQPPPLCRSQPSRTGPSPHSPPHFLCCFGTSRTNSEAQQTRPLRSEPGPPQASAMLDPASPQHPMHTDTCRLPWSAPHSPTLETHGLASGSQEACLTSCPFFSCFLKVACEKLLV